MKFLRFLTILSVSYCLLVTSSTPPALAHGDIFFEYAPDAWQSTRLAAADSATPYLLFSPQSSFSMSGFNLWLDNPGTGGTINFTLLDENDAVLATKSATVPTIPLFPGGNKFHVDWPAPVSLLGSQTYILKISSTLPELGLYYADRVSIIEHNRDWPTPYSSGAARLGNELQNFTFKFSLYQESASADGSQPVAENLPAPTSTQISISGARVVTVTGNTALFAWSSNIAADSKVSVRTQLNPLYVIASGYDPTLELEHTVLVSGLNPNINYFADILSSDGNQLTLTTYTISFKTLAVSDTPTVQPPPAQQPPANQPPVNQPPTSQPPIQTSENPLPAQQQAPSNQTAGSPAQTDLSVNSAGDSGSVNFSWNEPDGGEPDGGYRIDIFDYNYRLEKQINLPAGSHSQIVGGLTAGTEHAIVYANENGVFTKVAPAKDFVVATGAGKIVNKIILLSLAWIAGLAGYFYWKSKRKSITLGSV